jgi:hypothetical protein
MNRSYPHFPSFSIIFHNFPSFSIIFHHFPQVNTWSKPGQHVPTGGWSSQWSQWSRDAASGAFAQGDASLTGATSSTPNRPQMIDPSTHWDFLGLTKSMTFLWWVLFLVLGNGVSWEFFWCTGSAGRLGDSPLTDYRCFCMLLPSRAPLIGDFLLPCLMSEG